jgi:DNA-binding GntR family transcriptional regulator
MPRADTLASGLDQLTSLESLAEANGGNLSSTDVEIEEISLDADTAGKMSVEPGTVALVVRRVKILRDARVAWIVDYIPAGVLPFGQIRAEFTGSVLDLLLNHPELQVEYADANLTAMPADRTLAKRLDVRTGTPVLSLEEVTLTRSGRAVNLSQCWMLPDYFNFTLRRRRGHN